MMLYSNALRTELVCNPTFKLNVLIGLEGYIDLVHTSSTRHLTAINGTILKLFDENWILVLSFKVIKLHYCVCISLERTRGCKLTVTLF